MAGFPTKIPLNYPSPGDVHEVDDRTTQEDRGPWDFRSTVGRYFDGGRYDFFIVFMGLKSLVLRVFWAPQIQLLWWL